MADRLPISHGGSPCLSLSGVKIILAERVRALAVSCHLACARNERNVKKERSDNHHTCRKRPECWVF